MPAHVIAEGGTNHGGNLETAKLLVDAAVSAGADSFKAQIIYPDQCYLPRFYRDGRYVANEVYQQRTTTMLPDEDYARLADYCRSCGIEFAATVFDSRSVALVDALDVPYIKTASCDLTDSRLLEECAATGRRLVISTGMSTLAEIERAVSDVTATGHRDIVLMHCVSVYPCPLEDMNLTFIKVLRDTFGLPVGLSDHSESNLPAVVAVGMGATWFEKHLTLDRTAIGSDHSFAMEASAFRSYVDDVRAAERACASHGAKVGTNECAIRSRVRRAVYAARDISTGEVIQEADVLIVRPEGPLAPNDAHLVLGRRAARAIAQFEPLARDSVCQ